MTYCLAIHFDQGLVFCSDSRTNAGADRLSSYSKMHRFEISNERELVLLSAGNLATTQAVIDQATRDLATEAKQSLATVPHIAAAADYIGRLSRDVQNKYTLDGEDSSFNAEATFILGGQFLGQKQELYLIYAQGNHIHPSKEHPYLQIGEVKYGRPMLHRIAGSNVSPEIAMRCALVSMDSTLRSNATVGPPIELLHMATDKITGPHKYHSFSQDDPYLRTLSKAWNEELVRAFGNLPELSQAFESDE